MSNEKTNICPVCKEAFSRVDLGFLTPHRKVTCIICSKDIGKSCAHYGKTNPPLPEKEGDICPDCFRSQRLNITKDDFVANRLHETSIQAHNLIQKADTTVKEWLTEADKRIENRLIDIEKRLQKQVQDTIHQSDTTVKGWLTETDKRIENRLIDIEKRLQKQVQDTIHQFFNYLWMMLFFSIFIGFYGLFLFLLAERKPNPETLIIIFRLGLIVFILVPWLIWFISSLIRAYKNRSLEKHLQETRNGNPLRLRDYLFGIFYFHDSVQNIWFPIAFLGTVLSILLYVVIKIWIQ